eukprot:7416669-Prorocentrum_lima.AAC.1
MASDDELGGLCGSASEAEEQAADDAVSDSSSSGPALECFGCNVSSKAPVSYTHLTLPTICSV